MPNDFSGGCACGAIRYQCTAEPFYMGNCHCRDCQRATGSAYFPAVVVSVDEFTLLQGEPTWYESKADRGHTMARAFCNKCGSPVLLNNGANDTVTVLYAESLDDPSWYKPKRDIYTSSAQPWDLMHPDTQKCQAMP